MDIIPRLDKITFVKDMQTDETVMFVSKHYRSAALQFTGGAIACPICNKVNERLRANRMLQLMSLAMAGFFAVMYGLMFDKLTTSVAVAWIILIIVNLVLTWGATRLHAYWKKREAKPFTITRKDGYSYSCTVEE